MSVITFTPSKMGRLKELTSILAVEEEQIMSFFEICPNLLCVLDKDTHILLSNDAWELELGYSKASLSSAPLLSLVVAHDRKSFEEVVDNLQESQITRSHIRCISKSGCIVHLEWDMTLGNDGNIYASARRIPAECFKCARQDI